MASRGRLVLVLFVLLGYNRLSSFVAQQHPAKRSVASLIVKFSLEKLASFALDEILKTGTEDDMKSKLKEISKNLEKITDAINELTTIVKELKETQTIIEASSIERLLRVKIDAYQTIINAAKNLKGNDTEAREKLVKDAKKLSDELRTIPGLLVQFDLLVTGVSTVGAGRLDGLVCDYNEHTLRELRSATSGSYNVSNSVLKMHRYIDSLIQLQVMSFQLYNTTCSDGDLKCRQEQSNLETRLQGQQRRFESCVPDKLEKIVENGYLKNMNIIDNASNTVLYSEQRSSIVTVGSLDWDKIDSPKDAGLRCPTGEPSEVYSLEAAEQHGRKGYYLKQKSGCYMSYDREFLVYEKLVPTFWSAGDRIDRKEFLICQPFAKEHTVTFLLSADEADIDSSYTLKNADTGKYLSIHVEKTSVHDTMKHRLILVLFLDGEMSNSWNMLPEGSVTENCDENSETKISTVSGEDKGYGILIGSSVGEGIVAIFVFVFCYCCCCKRQ